MSPKIDTHSSKRRGYIACPLFLCHMFNYTILCTKLNIYVHIYFCMCFFLYIFTGHQIR